MPDGAQPEKEFFMRMIEVLDQHTIDKIAAGEVVERPSSVVKELVENAIDAGATAVTVEIADGGKKLIRITDNGCGIEAEQVPRAFLSHATSKIRKVEDLENITSLGFRGEALSSIAAVSQVELITKTPSAITGTRYVIEGGREVSIEETGAPDGTTFLVRNLFYNVPARSKFLKSDMTEAGYISALMEQLALSHPEISFKYIQNKQVKLHSSGNYNARDVIYSIYGKEITRSLLPVSFENDFMKMTGFAGKPEISRGNRSFENYYINGRFVKDKIITKAIEDAYKGFLMQHKFPFVSLSIEMNGNDLDVNVHPSKMEVRFARGTEVYEAITEAIRSALSGRELIPRVSPGTDRHTAEKQPETGRKDVPEPFEVRRREAAAGLPSRETTADWSFPASSLPSTLGDREKPYQAHERQQGGTPYQRQERQSEGTPYHGQERQSEGTSYHGQERQSEGTSYHGQERQSEDTFNRISREYSETGNTAADHAGTESIAADHAKTEGTTADHAETEGTSADHARTEGMVADPSRTEGAAALQAGTKNPAADMTGTENAAFSQTRTESTPEDHININDGTDDHPESLTGEDISQNSGSGTVSSAAGQKQLDLFSEDLLTEKARIRHKLIGQLFDTYWLVQYGDNFYIIDQHAAHEKVYYERFVRQFREKQITSQLLSPPLIVSLNLQEEQLLQANMDYFTKSGFEIENFGGKEYAISAVPSDLYLMTEEELFHEMLDHLGREGQKDAFDIFASRLATMACKAAVKGNHAMSPLEADHLIDELLGLENPYNCPHGRPTIIAMTKTELEKKFHRIV